MCDVTIAFYVHSFSPPLKRRGGGIFPSPGEPAVASSVVSVPSAADAFVHEPLVSDEHRSFPFFESSPDDDRVVVWVRHADDAIVHLARHHARRFLRPFRRARKIVMVEDVLALCEPFEFGTVETGGVFEIGDDRVGDDDDDDDEKREREKAR